MIKANFLPANVQQKNLLYDFYGGLLTEKQRSFFTMHYMEDFSLAEIGEHCDVTPQAVADLLKRAGNSLEGYEARLGLVKKFAQQQEVLRLIQGQTEVISRLAEKNKIPALSEAVETIKTLTFEMLL